MPTCHAGCRSCGARTRGRQPSPSRREPVTPHPAGPCLPSTRCPLLRSCPCLPPGDLPYITDVTRWVPTVEDYHQLRQADHAEDEPPPPVPGAVGGSGIRHQFHHRSEERRVGKECRS